MTTTNKARKTKTTTIKLPTHAPASDVEASLLRGAAQAVAFVRGDRGKARVTKVQLTARNTPRVKPAPQLAASRLKQIRSAHGMSQPVFARVLDVSPETLKGWEQGRKRPRGPVRRLLQVMERHPNLVEEMTRDLIDT
ncbi:MAG: helix-turn-helix domain-containing protein [Gemmatimonadaceae bacterium]